MTGTSTVTLAELRRVLSSLETQRDTILNEYRNRVRGVLESSQQCFQVAGVDFASIQNTFNENFNMFNKEMTALIDQLNNVILNYSELSDALRQMFNSDFATKIRALLELK